MADLTQLRRLVAYNQWADEKILAAIDGMTQAELDRKVEAYFGTLAENLRHNLGAQRLWLARWKGAPNPSLDAPPAGQWRAAFAEVHAGQRRFVEALTAAEAERTTRWTDLAGHPHEGQLDQLIVHTMNHGTHHRAEAGLLLERIGRSPGDMDYVYFHLEAR
jgi:uncharacterized damage-inducible protein DinB